MLVVLLTVLPSAPLDARGKGEERDLVAEARALFEQKRYDDTRKILAEIIRTDPEKFDAVEEIMEDLREVEAMLNEKLQEIETVLFEELDEDRALALVEDYRLVDPYPNARTESILTEIEKGAVIVTNLRRFNDLMDAAAEELGAGDYAGAMEIYLPGFDIFKERFETAGYGNIVVTAGLNAVERVRTTAAGFAELAAGSESSIAAYGGALTETREEALAELAAQVVDVVGEIVDRERTLEEADAAFREQFQVIEEQTGRTDYFLYTADILMRGRSDSETREGILLLFELLYEEPFAESIRRTEDMATVALARMEKGLAEGRFDESAAESFRGVARALMTLLFFHDTGRPLEGEYDLAWQNLSVEPASIADFIEVQADYRLTYGRERFLEAIADLPELRALPQPPERTVLVDTAPKVLAAADRLGSQYRQWSGYEALLAGAAPEAAESAGHLAEEIGSAAAAYLGQYVRLAGSLLDAASERYAKEDDKLRNGEPVVISVEAEITRIVKFPDVRKASFEEIREDLGFLVEEVDEFAMGLDAPVEPVRELAAVQEAEVERERITRDAAELLQSIEGSIALAVEQSIQADRHVSEGQKLFAEAQSAFSSRRYEDARESVNEAMEKLYVSLEYREDEEVRRLRDEVYPAFLNQINLQENEKVITEVRELIRRGIRLYRESKFVEAQSVLVQAQSRWLDVSPTENEEVADWLTLVKKAINLKKGWEIKETEAPYEQITQLLRLAAADYNRAVKLLEDGNQKEAEDRFQEALTKLDQIKINFPKLKEANTLRLQIIRLLNPEEYRVVFQAELDEAQNVLAGGDQVAILQTYSTLKDYERMESGSRTLQDLLYRYEITLGLRLPPASSVDIGESREKYDLAADIFNKRQRDLYDTAIDLLNEALKLWPDNTEAEDLKDDILRNLGQVKQTLTTDDVRKIEEAERLFGERNYTGSWRIVQELLKTPSNRNNERITDLQAKLETRLGIETSEG